MIEVLRKVNLTKGIVSVVCTATEPGAVALIEIEPLLEWCRENYPEVHTLTFCDDAKSGVFPVKDDDPLWDFAKNFMGL